MGKFLLRVLGCVPVLLSIAASAYAAESSPPPNAEPPAAIARAEGSTPPPNAEESSRLEEPSNTEESPNVEDSSNVEDPSRIEKVEDDLRFRFGVQGGLTLGAARGASGNKEINAFALALSLGVELGVQTSRHFGLFVRGEVASVLIMNQAALYLMAEYTPVAPLSLGIGAGVDGFMLFWIGGTNVSPAWSGVSVPISVALNLTETKAFERGGRRAPLRIQFIAAPGIDPESGIFGMRGSVGFGASWM